MKKIIGILILVALMCGCKHIEYIPIETTKTEYIHNTDSIVQYDSIYVERLVNADTVYKTEYRFKSIFKTRVDTVRICDSIPVPIETEKIVEVVPALYRCSLWICVALLVVIMLFFMYNVRKK